MPPPHCPQKVICSKNVGDGVEQCAPQKHFDEQIIKLLSNNPRRKREVSCFTSHHWATRQFFAFCRIFQNF